MFGYPFFMRINLTWLATVFLVPLAMAYWRDNFWVVYIGLTVIVVYFRNQDVNRQAQIVQLEIDLKRNEETTKRLVGAHKEHNDEMKRMTKTITALKDTVSIHGQKIVRQQTSSRPERKYTQTAWNEPEFKVKRPVVEKKSQKEDTAKEKA
jgi:hypothetical protein